jgi:hypothetical protein
MLGVSSAATVGLHFQVNYCDSQDYSGFPVTLTAFGIPPSGWQNLTQMDTGYGCGAYPQPGVGNYFTLQQNGIGSTNTSAGLNPLPNGSLNVAWSAYTANYVPFVGYGAAPPYYYGPGGPAGALSVESAPISGEQQVYASFLRDGLNFGPGSGQNGMPNGENDQPGYLVDVTGLKSLFTNSPFVVELMASADSTQVFTNAFVVDVANSITNSVSYPNTPPVQNTEGTQYWQGSGGGLSTVSGAFTNIDEIKIFSATPYHQENGTSASPGTNHCGTICGFILTDKPVVSMSPQPIAVAGPGDTIALNPYVIGVPPLSYQWQFNGQSILHATNSTYTISSFNLAAAGSYKVIVTNLYGAATSQVATITGDRITQGPTNGIVYDSNPDNTQNDGVNMGATWEASSTDADSVTRTGVMDFDATNDNGITVADSPSFNGPVGTITFWMQSAGTDDTGAGGFGVSLFCRPVGDNAANDFILAQQDFGGYLEFIAPDFVNEMSSQHGVSDGLWHFVALTFDQSATGGAAWFIDGNLDTTNANAASWAWPAGKPLQIGYSSDSYWGSYNGLLNDFQYYNAILSASQIAALHSSGGLVDPAALQLQFNFAAPPGQGIVLNWNETSAVLQSAPTLNGPWTDLPTASSPYTIVPAARQQYFRYRYAPQSVLSNPYLM